ncbi:MAG: dienelactone hydrolase family protein [Acidimicrobiales bacterium]
MAYRPRSNGGSSAGITSRAGIVLAAVLLLVLVVAGCGSSKKKTKSRSSSKAPYAKAGPHAVGFTTLELAGGRKVFVWYPAAKDHIAGHAQEEVDIASLLSPALQAKIPPEDHVKYPANAYADAPAATGKGAYPLVLFSHGYAGFPEQSVSLTSHLASWGYVVAAPDHVERSLDGLLGTAGAGVPKSTDPQVLSATIDLLENTSKQPGILQGLVDPVRIAVTGHSAGASAAYQTASADPRVKGFISYAVGFGGSNNAAPPAAPIKPGMVMTGTADGVIPPSADEQVYAGMHPPKYFVKIAGAGHLVFSDICLIGRANGGIVGIAKALNLPIPADLLKLGSDGCGPNYPPPEKAFPAINQLSVAFLRFVFGQDRSPVGLDTAAVGGLGAQVTVQHQG